MDLRQGDFLLQSSTLLAHSACWANTMKLLSAVVLGCALFALTLTGQAAFVKKSTSGICHPPESSYYSRTMNFVSFESVAACLRSGGRLPTGLSGSPASTEVTDTGYSRNRFGYGWADADGDCQNSRTEALISQSTAPVKFKTGRNCEVTAGRWISPFTGAATHDAADIDIDHVVPLKWAWEHGAAQWPQEKRERFANDPVNLWSVELSLNRQKGAKGPDEWMPPVGRCQYVSRFMRIVKLYGLHVHEKPDFRHLLSTYCRFPSRLNGTMAAPDRG